VAPGPADVPGFNPPTPLVWFGVAGGAFAWAAVHVAGYESSLDRCIPTGTGSVVSLSAWQIAIAAGGAVIAVAAIAVSVWMFLHTFRIDDVAGKERRGDGSPPPVGRIQFLSMVGLTVNILALAIIVLDGVGAPLLTACQQS
jgi:multisubunit Na+/H+ antiporter MnhB subunit